jgi:hypothetical protein
MYNWQYMGQFYIVKRWKGGNGFENENSKILIYKAALKFAERN